MRNLVHSTVYVYYIICTHEIMIFNHIRTSSMSLLIINPPYRKFVTSVYFFIALWVVHHFTRFVHPRHTCRYKQVLAVTFARSIRVWYFVMSSFVQTLVFDIVSYIVYSLWSSSYTRLSETYRISSGYDGCGAVDHLKEFSRSILYYPLSVMCAACYPVENLLKIPVCFFMYCGR